MREEQSRAGRRASEQASAQLLLHGAHVVHYLARARIKAFAAAAHPPRAAASLAEPAWQTGRSLQVTESARQVRLVSGHSVYAIEDHSRFSKLAYKSHIMHK